MTFYEHLVATAVRVTEAVGPLACSPAALASGRTHCPDRAGTRPRLSLDLDKDPE